MNKRPLAAMGLIYLVVLATAVCLASIINLTVAIMAAIIGIAAAFVIRDFRLQILVITIPAVLGFGVMSLCQNNVENISAKLGEQSCMIMGEVVEVPKKQYERWYYVVDTHYIGIQDAPQNIRIRLSCRNSLEAEEGDIVSGNISFIQNSDERGYSSETALRADGIQARAWCSPYVELDVAKGETSLKYFPMKIRRAVIRAIRKTFPDRYAGMLCAMLLGDTSYLDDKIAENFRASGISHLMAVSGLHVSLLAYCVMAFLRSLRLPVKLNIGLTMIFILMFMAITGFSPSVTRAGIMHLMALAARLLLRDADNITSMSLSLLIMCIINPWSAADIGLQMSVSSTLGLIWAANRLNKDIQRRFNIGYFGFIPRLKSYVAESLVVSMTAAIFTMPMSAIYFGRVSLISPVTNLLCVYAATVFIVVGIIAIILSVIPFIGWILAFIPKLIVTILGAYLDFTVGLLAGMPMASVNSGYDYVPWFFLFALAIVLTAFAAAKRAKNSDFSKRTALAASCGVLALLFVSMTSYQFTASGGEIIIFGMQDGGVCVCAKNGTHAVISEAGGDSCDLQEISDAFSRCGVQKVDAVVVSQNSDERGKLADDLIEKYRPDYFAFGGERDDYALAVKAAKNNGTEMLNFGGEILLEQLNISLKMYVDAFGGCWQMLRCEETDVLICPADGDCALLPEEYRSCDAVIVGGTVKNLFYLSTGAVIISAENQKASEIASILRVKGFANIYLTSEKGTVKCLVKNGKLYIGSKEHA